MVRTIAYWVTTVLLALGYFSGGYFDIAQPEQVLEGARKLGYPLHFFTLLGVWKLAAAVVLLLPALPRAKEWAYAGIVINLTGAVVAHVHVKDPVTDMIAPAVLFAFAATSWALRLAGRRLPGPWL